MGVTIGTKSKLDIPNGRYPAAIFKISSRRTRFGPALLFEFVIMSTEHEGLHVDGMFPTVITSKNKLGRLMANVGYDTEKVNEIDADELHGKSLTIVVGSKQGTTYSFPTVRDTMSLG